MEDLRPSERGVADEPGIVDQYAGHLLPETHIPLLTSPKIEKVEPGTDTQVRDVQLIAPDEVQTDAPREEGHRQPERVRSIDATRKQPYFALRQLVRPRQSVSALDRAVQMVCHSISSRNARIG